MDTFEISIQRFDEFAREYAARFSNIDAYLPSVDKFCGLLSSIKPRILELACGPGNFTRYVKQRFPEGEYIATDLSPKMIEIARKQVKGVDFRTMDMRNISGFDAGFDAILCSFGLPFLSKSDAVKLIADCAKLLNKKGVIYLSTMEGDESMAGFETTSFSGDSKIYFNYHRQKDLETALTEQGFLICDIRRQDYMLPNGNSLIDMMFIGMKK
jgi:ubiquinone/menaquinone biosynthesis C-methylase UbiE